MGGGMKERIFLFWHVLKSIGDRKCSGMPTPGRKIQWKWYVNAFSDFHFGSLIKTTIMVMFFYFQHISRISGCYYTIAISYIVHTIVAVLLCWFWFNECVLLLRLKFKSKSLNCNQIDGMTCWLWTKEKLSVTQINVHFSCCSTSHANRLG